MSLDEVRRTMEAYLDALSSRGDYGRFFADDIYFDVLWSDTSAQGPEQVEETIRAVHEVAFDARSEVLGLVVGEHGAAAEFSFAGRHIGEFRGIPATGRRVRVAYSAFYEVADGKITELRVYLPVERLLKQLGADDSEPESANPQVYPDEDPLRTADEEAGRGPDRGAEHTEQPQEPAGTARAPAGRSDSPVASSRPARPDPVSSSERPGPLRRMLDGLVGRRAGSTPSSSRDTIR